MLCSSVVPLVTNKFSRDLLRQLGPETERWSQLIHSFVRLPARPIH